MEEDDDITVVTSNCSTDSHSGKWEEEEDLPSLVPSLALEPPRVEFPAMQQVNDTTKEEVCVKTREESKPLENVQPISSDAGEGLQCFSFETNGNKSKGDSCHFPVVSEKALPKICKLPHLDLSARENKWYRWKWNYDCNSPKETGGMLTVSTQLGEIDKVVSGEYALERPPKKPGGVMMLMFFVVINCVEPASA